MLTFADAFAGIGGFRLALERLGWKCVWSCEIDRYCRKTYVVNFGEYPEGDVTKIKSDKIPTHDVFCAGFPCQPFSIAGLRLGFEDVRGTLFFEIVRILRDKQPRAFLLENVEGLLSHHRGETLLTMLNLLAKTMNGQEKLSPYEDCLNYHVFWKVLNSKDFGVPQNRERVFIVGFKDFVPFEFPRLATLKVKLVGVLEKKVSDKYTLSPKLLRCLKEHRRRHEELGHGYGYRVLDPYGISAPIVVGGSGRERNLIANTLSGRYHKDGSENLVRIFGERQWDRVYSTNGVSPTIPTAGGGRHIPQFAETLRRLTPRECARLQGFPDSFRIPVSDTQAYKQFGNAVTVPVAEAIGKEMQKWLT